MSTTTENLNLFKYDPTQDAKKTFNIQLGLNDNWDKIDNIIPTKADITLNNLDDEGKEKFGGDWTGAGHIIIFSNRDLNTSSTPLEFMLDFLPDDNIYEVILNIGVNLTYGNSYCYGSVGLSMDIISSPFAAHRASGSATAGHIYTKNTAIIPVKNKKIYLSGDPQNKYSKGELVAVAYRKLGTGFETITQNEET